MTSKEQTPKPIVDRDQDDPESMDDFIRATTGWSSRRKMDSCTSIKTSIAGGASQYNKPKQSSRQRQSLRQSMKRTARNANPLQGSWPRTTACCLGVLIPLNFLVIVSLVVGLVLGKVEMPHEISHNDAVVRQQQMMMAVGDGVAKDAVISSSTKLVNQQSLDHLPALCLALFRTSNVVMDEASLPGLLESILSNETLLASYLDDTTPDKNTGGMSASTSLRVIFDIMQQEEDPMSSVAATEMADRTLQDVSQFFTSCGTAGGLVRDQWQQQERGMSEDLVMQQGDGDINGAPMALSFNYIRCVDREKPALFNFIMMPSEEDSYDALPSTQAELYTQSWKTHQQTLEQSYLAGNGNYTALEARRKSYAEATGDEKCAVNMPSAAWFWFTVMTTVGYGSQVPRTLGGRLLTYTAGFVSILLFGAVLKLAGSITTHLFNDFIHRLKKKVSRIAKVLMWGVLWVLWMLVISYQAMGHQNQRMEEELSMYDAYWFAFITTTTVGFGDYFLQPEGLFVSDLLGLWANFLVGFVFLSSFLTELSELFGSAVPSLSDNLQRKLKYAYDHKVPDDLHLRGNRRKDSQRKGSTPALGSSSRTGYTEDSSSFRTNEVKTTGSEDFTASTSSPTATQEHAPLVDTSAPQEKLATFTNAGQDCGMANAELYFNSTLWGPLGHGDPPISVSTYPGDQWFIAANGVYTKQFTVGEDAEQTFTI